MYVQVVSEDTVLYTAQKYVDSQQGDEQQQAARQQLALLVRCPHLSPFWLSAAARSEESQLLLAPMRDQLLELLQCLQVTPDLKAALLAFKRWVPDQPASWLLGKRQLKAQRPAVVTWQLAVSDLKQYCEAAASSKGLSSHVSPDVTPPVQGCAYALQLQAQHVEAGVKVGMFALPQTRAKVFVKCSPTFSAGGVSKSFSNLVLTSGISLGLPDFFIGPMAGGWDEAAWSAKGWPTDGNIVMKLSVL
jgi:hypothetical protein